MSLLDRITGMAQKAKDTAASKTIISKDKRLEQTMSNNIKLNDFYFEKVTFCINMFILKKISSYLHMVLYLQSV
jgi:hypothetical protein